MHLNVIAANQIELHFQNGIVVFFSHNTPVAAFVPKGTRALIGYFKTEDKHNVTTSNHISRWLNGAKATEVPKGYLDSLVGGA